MRLIGRPPIGLWAYAIGKLSVLGCWVALVVRPFWPDIAWYQSPKLDLLGAALLGMGVLLMAAGGVNLGSSLRVGLPTERTALKTGGVYKYTRNPMYVGGLLTCLAGVAWTANPMILVLSVVAAIVHHRIVLAEERYLAAEFGDA